MTAIPPRSLTFLVRWSPHDGLCWTCVRLGEARERPWTEDRTQRVERSHDMTGRTLFCSFLVTKDGHLKPSQQSHLRSQARPQRSRPKAIPTKRSKKPQVGALLYTICSGRPPFGAGSVQVRGP